MPALRSVFWELGFESRARNAPAAILALAPTQPVEGVALPDGAPYQVFLDPPAEEGRIGPLTGTWGTKAVPESFLIDRKGRLRYWFDNRRDWDSAVVETCLQSIIDEE